MRRSVLRWTTFATLAGCGHESLPNSVPSDTSTATGVDCDSDVDGRRNLACGSSIEGQTLGGAVGAILDLARASEIGEVDPEASSFGIRVLGAQCDEAGTIDERTASAQVIVNTEGDVLLCDLETCSAWGRAPDELPLRVWVLDSSDVMEYLRAREFPAGCLIGTPAWFSYASFGTFPIPDTIPADRGVWALSPWDAPATWPPENMHFVDSVTGDVWEL